MSISILSYFILTCCASCFLIVPSSHLAVLPWLLLLLLCLFLFFSLSLFPLLLVSLRLTLVLSFCRSFFLHVADIYIFASFLDSVILPLFFNSCCHYSSFASYLCLYFLFFLCGNSFAGFLFWVLVCIANKESNFLAISKVCWYVVLWFQRLLGPTPFWEQAYFLVAFFSLLGCQK